MVLELLVRGMEEALEFDDLVNTFKPRRGFFRASPARVGGVNGLVPCFPPRPSDDFVELYDVMELAAVEVSPSLLLCSSRLLAEESLLVLADP